ncbi:MAG: dipeptidase [Opitutaceae bacterium]|nr:dipeptidase [Opitutaceae bacterium]
MTRLVSLAEAGADRDEISNCYEEESYLRFLASSEALRNFKKTFDAAGVDCVFQNCGEEGNDIGRLIKRLARQSYLCDKFRDVVARSVFPEDVTAAREAGRHTIYMTTNGVPLPSPIYSVENALYYITVFYQLGVRMMHLTYNRRNLIGDGCAEPADGGLSEFGRAVIVEMNRVGIIPDVAHSGFRTSLEAAQCSKKPVVASHTVAGALSKHYRGKPDEVMREIVRTGGYMGICAIPGYYRGTGKIDSFLDHIEYVAERFGAGHVAIGTDRMAECFNPENFSKLNIPRARPIYEQFWPPAIEPFEETTGMSQSVTWTNWPLFTVGLVQRGFSDNDIRNIIGGNVMRVAQKTLEGCF